MKQFNLFLIFLGLVAVISIIASYYWFTNEISSPNGETNAPIIFEIKQGDSLETIAENLFSTGLLKDKNAFLIYAKLNPSLVEQFQAGFFEIPPVSSIKDIVVILQKAKNKEGIKITIPEGLRHDEVAGILGKYLSKNFNKEDFLNFVEFPDGKFNGKVGDFINQNKPEGKTLEGFLFPETYYFNESASALEVIEKMVSTLAEKLTREDELSISTSGLSTFEVLALASLVEREAQTVEDNSLIADILLKRLNKESGNPGLLMVDAALLYPEKDWQKKIKELKGIDSGYNTYLHPGLPPTPICNPGKKAIDSIIYHETTEFLYYLYDNTGKIHVAKTSEEHLNNIDKYL